MIPAISATIFSSSRYGNNGFVHSLLPKKEKKATSLFGETSNSQLSVSDMAKIISQLDI